MLEIVAHELARSTENTMRLLNGADPKASNDVASLFDTLREK